MDFSRLHITYRHFFKIVETPRNKSRYDNVYFMAFDAEWYQSGDKNVVLSYQIATVSRTASNNIIEFVAPGQRFKLAEIIEYGIRSVNNGTIPDNHATSRNLVVLISHSTVAEWSALADRDAPYITSQLTAIRKSPVTGLSPIKIILGDYICPCHVQLYDTRLIAPADFQSLKKLSTMLGSEDELKVEIGYHHIKRMDRLIKIDYKLYEKYALQDSEITLKLFFLLQSAIMELAGNNQKLYRTLASGAVTGYLKKVVNFKSYLNQLKSARFAHAYGLIRLAYHGGRNEGFMVGRSDRIPAISDRLWVDIDFTGCYPTAMALCPTIDCGVDPFTKPPKIAKNGLRPVIEPGKVIHLPERYQLPVMTAAELKEAGIKKSDYDKACEILNKFTPDIEPKYHAQLVAEWNRFTKSLPYRDRKRVVEKALVFDNTLIDQWYARYKNGNAERYLIPGFAKVRFAFDIKVVDGIEIKKDPARGDYITSYPCLPVAHPAYGLIYPIAGETYATASELMLAIDAGCHIQAIESVELPVVTDTVAGIPKRLFFEHLAELTVERNKQKKIIKGEKTATDRKQNAIVMERFIKEFMNSFYGKTAQAINYKKGYDPASESMVALGPSPISEACTATLTTGLPRAALSAVLLAVDRYNLGKPLSEQIIVASCTTDGLLVGMPRPEGVSAADYYEEKVRSCTEPVVDGVGGTITPVTYYEMAKGTPTVNEILTLCGCGDLIPLIESFLPIRQMRNSRKELTKGEDDTFLEIKHFADQVAGIKTRGQIGWLEMNDQQVVTIQAKFGLKPPVTDIIQNNENKDNLDAKKNMKELEAEYERVMSVGGSVKATLEGNWILEQIDRLNNGETDMLEYTFYGLKGFNDIIKGGSDLDLTQTTSDRIFNADFDWKRKLIVKDGIISAFSVPFYDIRDMLKHRNQVEKHHRWGKVATGETVIQSVAVKNSGINVTGGMAAAMVKQFLSGMLFGHISGGLKIADCSGRKDKRYDQIAVDVNEVWTTCGCSFERRKSRSPEEAKTAGKRVDKTSWSKSDIQNLTRSDKFVAAALPFQEQYTPLLSSLCEKFGINPVEAKEKIFATKLADRVDTNLMLQVALAILHAPGQGVEPFKSMYNKDQLPTRDEIVHAFQPHVPESRIASYEHYTFQRGQSRPEDKKDLVMYFARAGMRKDDAESCAKVMVSTKDVVQAPPPNRSKVKIVKLFAQALLTLTNPPVAVPQIVAKLRKHGLDVAQFHKLKNSKFEQNVIKNTTENRQEIRKLARMFSLDAAPFLDAMLEK